MGLEGKGNVRWTESHTTGTGDSQRTEYYTYSDSETYVDLIVIAWGRKDAPQPTRIDPGTFNFPFKFTIPPNCPPTFTSQKGQINYNLYGVISSQVNQYKIETPLTLNRLIDLNQQPNLLQPVEQSTVKDITLFCCLKRGAVNITFKMPRTGFCVGQERIPVTFEYRNGSSREISMRVELTQNTVYSASGHTKHSSETISNFACQIRPSQNETKSIEFDLPPTIQMPFSSRIINVAHSINVWVTHSLDFMFLAGPSIFAPIAIGNVPFRGQQAAVPGPAQPVPAGHPSSMQGLPPSNMPGYPPQGPAPPEGPVQPLATPEPSAVQASAPPNAELQSQAPPPYGFAVSEGKF